MGEECPARRPIKRPAEGHPESSGVAFSVPGVRRAAASAEGSRVGALVLRLRWNRPSEPADDFGLTLRRGCRIGHELEEAGTIVQKLVAHRDPKGRLQCSAEAEVVSVANCVSPAGELVAQLSLNTPRQREAERLFMPCKKSRRTNSS